jgi:hypothetical protein
MKVRADKSAKAKARRTADQAQGGSAKKVPRIQEEDGCEEDQSTRQVENEALKEDRGLEEESRNAEEGAEEKTGEKDRCNADTGHEEASTGKKKAAKMR